jgi:hypothetical protein
LRLRIDALSQRVGEIDRSSQFHQHFYISFSTKFLVPKSTKKPVVRFGKIYIYTWVQFHQLNGAKGKCTGGHSLAPFNFTNKTLSEDSNIICAVHFKPCPSKISENPLAQKAASKTLMKLNPKVNFINICARIFRAHKIRQLFLANGVRQMAYIVWRFLT